MSVCTEQTQLGCRVGLVPRDSSWRGKGGIKGFGEHPIGTVAACPHLRGVTPDLVLTTLPMPRGFAQRCAFISPPRQTLLLPLLCFALGAELKGIYFSVPPQLARAAETQHQAEHRGHARRLSSCCPHQHILAEELTASPYKPVPVSPSPPPRVNGNRRWADKCW